MPSLTAFAAPAAALRSTFVTSSRRALSSGRPLSSIPARAPAPAVTHVATQMQMGGTIDFSSVDMSSAGENLAGLVFTPEKTDALSTETRTDVGWAPKLAAALNRHINVEYTASYSYHALFAYFDRDTVALPGFAKYFNHQSVEEREHAMEFMQYQNKRGGKVELQPIAVPEMSFSQEDGTSDAIYAMELALQLEKFVYHKIMELYDVAEESNDRSMTDLLDDYLQTQVNDIKTVADYVAQLKRVGTGHGVYDFDKFLLTV
jgi:ferritin heavy chain